MLSNLMARGAENFARFKGDTVFLTTATGAAAMVINADGVIEENERKAATTGLSSHKILSTIYTGSEIVRALEDALNDSLTRAGKQKLTRALEEAARRPVQDREDIFLIAADTADAGGIGDKEKEALAKIAKALSVDGAKLLGESLPSV
jgi:tellurite resistance protein